MQAQAEPGRYLAFAFRVEHFHVGGAFAAPSGGAAAHVHLVKIFRLHRDRHHRQRRLPPDKVGGRLDRSNPLPAHERRRAKQPRLVQLYQPVHPFALSSWFGAVTRVADVHTVGCLGSDPHIHPGLVNTRLGGKHQL